MSASRRLVQVWPVDGFVRRTLKVVGVDVPWIAVIGRFVETVGRERTVYVTGADVLEAYFVLPEYVAVNG